MFNLPKNIQSNFSGRKNVIYMQSIITYILVDYSLGAQRNVCLKNSTWVAERIWVSSFRYVRILLQVWDFLKVELLILPEEVE